MDDGKSGVARMKKVLVTGGAGFTGSHIIERILRETDWKIISLDRLTYAGNLDRLAHLPKERIKVMHHDFREPFGTQLLRELDGVQYIIHNGAETHVRRSFANPEIFIESNIVGTFNVLEAARVLSTERFLYTSTDEVFGPATKTQCFFENDSLIPSNPYSASKAGGEMLVRAYFRAFQLQTIITRTMNMFGERQHPEKFIPMTIRKILNGEKVTIHVSKDKEIGSRQWLHAGVQASAIIFLLEKGAPGQVYHVAGEEHCNLSIARMIADILEMDLGWSLVNVYDEFPAHDLHYAIDATKIMKLGWLGRGTFEASLAKTVRWTKEHPDWLQE
jgi:dTDP-glucose 4,6-dehydratase